MRSPDSQEFLNVGTVRIAESPAHLVFTIGLVNPDGTYRLENLTTVDLADLGGETEVTVRVQVLHATAEADENLIGMHSGWSESLDDLAQLAHEDECR